LAKNRRIYLYFNDTIVLDACEYILIKKKIIKNNYIKNDKTHPYFVIIETPIDKKNLTKILNKTIKSQYIMR